MDPMTWVALGSAVLNAGAATSRPATPSMSASDPVYSALFDSSGWAMNWGGTQSASSSPSDKIAPVVSAPGQSAMASGGSAIDGNMLLMGGAVLLLLMLMK
jgi:hypothetical protein